jgi:hypothetical protein
MEWEKKVTMVKLGNKRGSSDEAKKEFQKFVLENIDSFDSQSWDMFCNLVELIIDDMKQDIEFWKQIYQKIKFVSFSDDEQYGFRAIMRISMIQVICEDELCL